MARSSLSTSVRRHFVDSFFFAHEELCRDKDVIDLGGKKRNKRGLFNIDAIAKQVIYVNLDAGTEPDILADVAAVPLPESSCDIIVLGETLEHVPDPMTVLKEAKRLLRKGGHVLATVPFIYPVHADPHDFGRYTDFYWRSAALSLGLELELERQGAMFAIVALMIQHLFNSKKISWRPIQIPLVKFFLWLDSRTTNKLLLSWTTGYGIVFKK